jgi:hypothetical protein
MTTVRLRALDGTIYEAEESLLENYRVPAEEVARQLQQLKTSLRLDLKRELAVHHDANGAPSRSADSK